ncbi:MAG: hypothetical protein JWM53_6114, partial [bacterium]|nr:hypothetical protein [bacterium]
MRAMAIVLVLACGVVAADERPRHKLPKAQHGGTVVGLCDGETTTEVNVAPEKMTRAQAQAASDELMAAWRKKHPEARWDDAIAQNGPGSTSAQTSAPSQAKPTTATKAPAATQPHDQTGTYAAYDARDELVWKAETQKFVDEGNAIFHDAKKLGGTISVSCDMCHPNAANTHPE